MRMRFILSYSIFSNFLNWQILRITKLLIVAETIMIITNYKSIVHDSMEVNVNFPSFPLYRFAIGQAIGTQHSLISWVQGKIFPCGRYTLNGISGDKLAVNFYLSCNKSTDPTQHVIFYVSPRGVAFKREGSSMRVVPDMLLNPCKDYGTR